MATSSGQKALIVKGPRQVGKTASILHFGQSHYKSVITINFVEEPNYKQIVADGYSVDAIIKTSPSWILPKISAARHTPCF